MRPAVRRRRSWPRFARRGWPHHSSARGSHVRDARAPLGSPSRDRLANRTPRPRLVYVTLDGRIHGTVVGWPLCYRPVRWPWFSHSIPAAMPPCQSMPPHALSKRRPWPRRDIERQRSPRPLGNAAVRAGRRVGSALAWSGPRTWRRFIFMPLGGLIS